MVKIKDLNDDQLDKQISKYQKILNQLIEEKKRRGDFKEDVDLEHTQEYQLKLGDDELELIAKKKEQQSSEKEEEVKEKEVGVTQILKINKDLLKK